MTTLQRRRRTRTLSELGIVHVPSVEPRKLTLAELNAPDLAPISEYDLRRLCAYAEGVRSSQEPLSGNVPPASAGVCAPASEGWSVDLEEVQALVAQLRAAIRPRDKRKRLDLPHRPSGAEWTKAKTRGNAGWRNNPNADMKAIFYQAELARRAEQHVDHRGEGRDYAGAYLRMWGYFATLTYRTFNDLHLASVDLPREPVLRAALESYAETYMSKFLSRLEPTEPRSGWEQFAYVTPAQVEVLSATMAMAVLRDWRPEYIVEMRRRGSEGGRNSRVRSFWDDPDNLDELERENHRSKRELMAWFDLGDWSISEGRRRLRQRQT